MKHEIDLIALAGDLIISGEVKRTATWFTKKQIENDTQLSAALGARRHVLVSMTPIPQAIIDLAAAAATRRHLGLAVLHPPVNRLQEVVADPR